MVSNNQGLTLTGYALLLFANNVFCFRFLPRLAKSALEQSLEEAGIIKQHVTHSIDSIEKSVTCKFHNSYVVMSFFLLS